MNEHKKLDTFNFRDKYGWAMDAILTEAHATAVRRADMMNWQDVTVRESGKASTKDGEFTCYSFEIWGIENQTLPLDQKDQEVPVSNEIRGQAARDINP